MAWDCVDVREIESYFRCGIIDIREIESNS
jgi:hypothetical protein